MNLSLRRSVALLYMLCKIRINPIHPICGARHVAPFVRIPVTRGSLVATRCFYGPPRSRTSHYRLTFIPHSVSLYNDLVDSACLMVWN